ncbi:uncharacterized protein LOC118205464 [Stegodyphus dumicola]|uniref:uncharacterized protein LOC118205464 n=1 Tax=Stegodyphus dumicola TaxID=202533 RepID=UPI0015AA33F0|nr:uncharacterized protein LOC118205464 [Stegodyphus dumicola]
MITFKDDFGLLRVRTKLILSDEDENFKCPILLPGNHALVHRLIEQKHRRLQHAGTGTLICNLREDYWIVGVRRLVKRICSKCVICKRFKGKSVQPPVAPLPKDRIKYAGAFEVTGIDLAGPLYVLSGEKAWIVIFTCAIYRAVHFELTKSLSADSFIMALRRFIARRGRISILYTDNGTNFVDTNNALNELDWGKIMELRRLNGNLILQPLPGGEDFGRGWYGW